MKFGFKILVSLVFTIILFGISRAENINPIYLNEGFTENQIYNIKVYTTRALNLVLDAQKALKKEKVVRKEVYSYLDGALFFLNEAGQYSPSYLIKRQIEATTKMIDLYPEEDYTADLKGIYISIEEVAGNLENHDYIQNKLNELLSISPMKRNRKIYDKLDTIRYTIKISVIDEPLAEARNFIAVAKDHVRAKRYIKAQKALELALSPLEKLAYKENLYIALTKEYVYKAYNSYYIDINIAKRYLISSIYSINKASYLSSVENRDLILGIRNKILKLGNKLEKYSTAISGTGYKIKETAIGKEIDGLFNEIFKDLNEIK